VPLADVVRRIPADGRRPLAADRAQLEQLFFRRQMSYAQAHVRIDASAPIPAVVERLLEWIEF
jgi:shikimate kinase